MTPVEKGGSNGVKPKSSMLLLVPAVAALFWLLSAEHTVRRFATTYIEVPVWRTTAEPSSLAHSNEVATLLRSALSDRTPVVIRGGVSHWPAVTAWAKDFEQTIMRCAPPGHRLDLQMTTVEQDGGRAGFVAAPIGVFAQWMREMEAGGVATATNATKPRLYLSEMESFNDLCPEAPEFMQDMADMQPFREVLPCGSMFPGSWIPYVDAISEFIGTNLDELTQKEIYPTLWWGPRGTRTGLHYDIEKHNLLGQVRGQKKVTLISPDQSAGVYPSSVWDKSAVASKVDLWSPNLTKFPAFGSVRPVHVTILPGDLLYVPEDWWHAVESLEESISISIRVQRTTWREIFHEGLDMLHEVGLWPLPGWLGGEAAGCTCHGHTIKVDNVGQINELRLGRSAHENERAVNAVRGKQALEAASAYATAHAEAEAGLGVGPEEEIFSQRRSCPLFQQVGCVSDSLEKAFEQGLDLDFVEKADSESIWMCCCPKPYGNCAQSARHTGCDAALHRHLAAFDADSDRVEIQKAVQRVRGDLLKEHTNCSQSFGPMEPIASGLGVGVRHERSDIMCEAMNWLWEELGMGDKETFKKSKCPIPMKPRADGSARKGQLAHDVHHVEL